jgi:hypothetical protein
LHFDKREEQRALKTQWRWIVALHENVDSLKTDVPHEAVFLCEHAMRKHPGGSIRAF